MSKFNDIDLNKWKESEIWTDSLWLISERDNNVKHEGSYHGNFVPQIPRQLISRYTRKGDVVFDPFVGSGTTAYEAESLGRHFIGVDIQPELIKRLRKNVDNNAYFSELLVGDSASESIFSEVSDYLKSKRKEKVQLAILHPPYADIIKFSEDKNDLSNTKSLRDFLDKFSKVVANTIEVLEEDRYLALVIGDKYAQSKWIPLGFYCMNEVQKQGLLLKSIIVKNMNGNRAKQNKEGIWQRKYLGTKVMPKHIYWH